MKYFKLFITVCAMAIAMNASAQSKTTAKSKTSTAKTTTAAPAKKTTTTTAKPATTTAKPATTTTTSKPVTTASTTRTTTTTTRTTTTASKPATVKKSSYVSNDDRGFAFLSETKIGSYYGTGGFGENLVFEWQFNKWFAWDFASIDFSAPFSFDAFSIGLKTGVRGFTPRFASDKLRGFGTLALGWDMGIMPAQTISMGPREMRIPSWNGHGFGLSFGLGVEAFDVVSLGYTLEYSTVWKSTAHYAKIGVRF